MVEESTKAADSAVAFAERAHDLYVKTQGCVVLVGLAPNEDGDLILAMSTQLKDDGAADLLDMARQAINGTLGERLKGKNHV